MFDLHSHSTCSDGRLEPAALVAAAADAGVQTLALTDHDSIDGLAAAAEAGAAHGVALVAGVEISVSWQRRTLHIVGLAFDPDAPALAAGLARLQAQRRRRAEIIAARLKRLGVNNALAGAAQLAGPGQMGRNHFARLLVEQGHCKTVPEAFKRYLRPGRPAHATVAWAGLDEAIGWIQAAGGIAVLAHPLAYRLSGAWRRRMYAAFAAAGGDATEICTGTTRAADIALSIRDAENHGLLGSVGSDFHGFHQHWLGLGRLAPLPDTITPAWCDPRFRRLCRAPARAL